jgi:hypothetical protein
MLSLKEMNNKLFFPFEKELSVAILSDEEKLGISFHNLFYTIFDSVDSILNHIGNIQYLRENETFYFIINTSTVIKFSLSNLVIGPGVSIPDISTHDILIPIFRLNKYTEIEYDSIPSETDHILNLINKDNISTIVCYLNTEYFLKTAIEDESQWQFLFNELLKFVIDNDFETEITLTDQGRSTYKGLCRVFNYHSKQQREFQISQKVNFFYCDNANSEILFGKNEFFANLIMHMLNFDKLNSYTFQVN